MDHAVGIRKLRDGLTHYVARVRRGTRLVITDRGQPVAVLVPYRPDRKSRRADRLAALLAGGHIGPAERHFMRRPPLIRGRGPFLSVIIAESRR
jgi:prevent-host-death family protein